MEAPAERRPIGIADHLAGKEHSPVRHEYIGGAVYGTAGGSRAHNRITLNLAAGLDRHTRGGPCEVFVKDFKVRPLIQGEDILHYPDAAVTRDPRDTDPFFLRVPGLIIEVLPETTEQADRREKPLACRSIPTLEEYVLAAQARREIAVFRREDGWKPQALTPECEIVPLSSVGLDLPVAEVYRRVFA